MVVMLHVDNEVLRGGLLKGSIDDPLMQVLLQEIFALSLSWDFKVKAQQILSIENRLADTLSCHNFATIQQEFSQANQLLLCMQQRKQFQPDSQLSIPANFAKQIGCSKQASQLI